MANFFAWITATTNLSADPLIAGMVRRGYEASILGDAGQLIEQGEVSCLIAIRLCRDIPGERPQRRVLDTIQEVYEEMGATYHSLVVLQNGGACTWEGSNIKLSMIPLPPAPPPAKTKYERLNEDDDGDQEKEAPKAD